MSGKIIYTYTDEAPMLATHALYPIIQSFAKPCGVELELADISVAGRVLAAFPETLSEDQRQRDELAELGQLAASSAEANIVKLPNISASIPQLHECIEELQGKGYNVPGFSQEPSTEAEKAVNVRYAKVLGSAVNPVLREGNSDRRAAAPVKAYAQKNPHKLETWAPGSKTHVASMRGGDFFSSEKTAVMNDADTVKIELVTAEGTSQVLKEGVKLQKGEVIDAAVMSAAALRDFFEKEMQDCKANGLLLSLHLKATMMKISDPIFFGHCVSTYFKDAFAKHAETFKQLGVNPNNGLEALFKKLETLPEERRNAIAADIKACYSTRPPLAMVNSDEGITNLHVPSDIIIDASMPPMIRDGGMMWNADNKLQETKCLIPDRCYAGIYSECIKFCQVHGKFDVSTMGHVSNVGLMAQKAEEYGSHGTTFEVPAGGVVRVVSSSGTVYLESRVEQGDIWRMCMTKEAPIKDWVKLAVVRARASNTPAIFWLSSMRAHDRTLAEIVRRCLEEHDIEDLDIRVMEPEMAIRFSMERARFGKDTISVTGNVLRDYLTDLFPILELGTSAKMLSIVPLLAGGGLYETGAGGSAPKHVEQFQKEGHLRWDSLGEYLALAVSLEQVTEATQNPKAKILGDALNEATAKFLDARKSPSRRVREIDNRGSHFYLSLYWAQAMAAQTVDAQLADIFTGMAEDLAANETRISKELVECQGSPVDLGGYYKVDKAKAVAAMNPSSTFNSILAMFREGPDAKV